VPPPEILEKVKPTARCLELSTKLSGPENARNLSASRIWDTSEEGHENELQAPKLKLKSRGFPLMPKVLIRSVSAR
jgi:hypothetical protein